MHVVVASGIGVRRYAKSVATLASTQLVEGDGVEQVTNLPRGARVVTVTDYRYCYCHTTNEPYRW